MCGYAVEWLRSCYHSAWKLFRGSDQLTAGRYYFAAKGTPHYPGLHNLWSANWVSDELDPPPALGEFPPLHRDYDKGALGDEPPPAVLLGTADCVASGDSLPVASTGRSLPCGIDSRCYVQRGRPVPVCPHVAHEADLVFGGSSTVV